jgi:hypothetical protein
MLFGCDFIFRWKSWLRLPHAVWMWFHNSLEVLTTIASCCLDVISQFVGNLDYNCLMLFGCDFIIRWKSWLRLPHAVWMWFHNSLEVLTTIASCCLDVISQFVGSLDYDCLMLFGCDYIIRWKSWLRLPHAVWMWFHNSLEVLTTIASCCLDVIT